MKIKTLYFRNLNPVVDFEVNVYYNSHLISKMNYIACIKLLFLFSIGWNSQNPNNQSPILQNLKSPITSIITIKSSGEEVHPIQQGRPFY